MNFQHAFNRFLFKRKVGILLSNLAGKYSIEPVGSRMTCNPAPKGTDQDWLVQVLDPAVFMDIEMAFSVCYVQTSGVEYAPNPSTRIFYRKGQNNIILTQDALYCRRFRNATKICKELNVLDKAERKTIFVLACGDITTVPVHSH